jgi:hypothetical protein
MLAEMAYLVNWFTPMYAYLRPLLDQRIKSRDQAEPLVPPMPQGSSTAEWPLISPR